MQIKRFSAENYKSILSIPNVELTNGFNVISGQNGAGKTALLELLSLDFGAKPHRSLKTVVNRGDRTNDVSAISTSLRISAAELRRILRNKRERVAIPMLSHDSDVARSLQVNQWNADTVRRFIEWFLQQAEFTFEMQFNNGSPVMPNDRGFWLQMYRQRDQPVALTQFVRFTIDVNDQISIEDWGDTDQRADIRVRVAVHLKEYVYRFGSERTVRARSPHGTNPHLHSNATNLAEVFQQSYIRDSATSEVGICTRCTRRT
jgi:energy-coupling factor transporter ATP-binding protein EcfA2